jgi:uncharacterized protein (UPF0548 family)
VEPILGRLAFGNLDEHPVRAEIRGVLEADGSEPFARPSITGFSRTADQNFA